MAAASCTTPTTSSSWSARAPSGCAAWAIRSSELAAQYGFVFAVVEAHVNYRKPARLDDDLDVSCVPVPEGRASIRFKQVIKRAGAVIAEGEVRVACVDAKSFRPRALPDFIQQSS